MSLNDPLQAFTRHTHVALEGSGRGSLLGLSFGVKDVFDIAGHRTGNGNPTFFAAHLPAQRTASAVTRLLAAGARMIGKTQCDEMAYSLNGENVHYGTPVNPKAKGRIPGGSSSGSAVAVSGGLVDFALGTDCGGSVRVPASYCGVYGLRTTHAAIACDGIVPLAASFDTVGFFAREARVMRAVGEVLLPAAPPFAPKRLLVATDAVALADPMIASALAARVATLRSAVSEVVEVKVYTGDPADWSRAFRILQGAEIWAQHGDFVRRFQPHFGPGVNERFAWASTIDPADVVSQALNREVVARHMAGLLGDDALMCLPTVPGIALKPNIPPLELEVFRARAFALLAIAGLARLPQISLPVATFQGCPVGLSLIGPRGTDRGLLDFVATHVV
jgi:amidase